MKQGNVFLVGAGPGDIQLITVKGLEAIRKADVILYDRLVNPKLLDFAGEDCELIYCGKLPDRHILRQEHINALLVEHALQGKTVVRLKGGDPGVFGRVGEEAAELAEHAIPFEIVPGITSGIAASAYAGIPVTHREYGGSFAVVTAHDKSLDGKPSINWEALTNGIDTIAFYMGVSNLPFICENMVGHGKPADTPVILIQWGTMGRQKTLEGTLSTIVQKVEEAKFTNPAITLVGDIVSVRNKINWFEKKPLFGRQILLARTGSEESKVASELREQGADVIEFPKWKKKVAGLTEQKRHMLSQINQFDNIYFASPESTEIFFQLLSEAEIDIRSIRAKLFGLSKKSVEALHARGLLAKVAKDEPVTGNLMMVGDDSVETHRTAYTITYGSFELFTTHQKEIDQQYIPIFLRMIEEATLDSVIFPSSLSVSALLDGLSSAGLDLAKTVEGLEVLGMGKKTKQTAEAFGLSDVKIPEKPDLTQLISYLKNKKGNNKEEAVSLQS